jgi:hypothetical protein
MQNEELTKKFGVSREVMTIGSIAESVLSGEANPLDGLAALKLLEDMIANAKDIVKPIAMEEASKQPEKTFELNGVKFTRNNGRANYSFKGIAEIEQAEKRVADLKERSKTAAINAQKGLTVVSEDAEIIQPCTITYSEDYLSISFK